MNIENACLFAKETLKEFSDSPLLDAELILSDLLDKDRAYLKTWPERPLLPQEIELYRQRLEKRVQGEPIAYILGYQYFWGLKLKVSPDVLVPRPDTETLVEAVLDSNNLRNQKYIKCLDLGTGSGAIALALASECSDWDILAIDQSVEALEIARQNQASLGFKNVNFLQSNWFENIASKQRFDVIASNPPYIDKADIYLCEQVRKHEPEAALISGKNGLEDIEKIIKKSTNYLNNNGKLFIEHGFQQGELVLDLFYNYGYCEVKRHDDLSGHWRVTSAVKV